MTGGTEETRETEAENRSWRETWSGRGVVHRFPVSRRDLPWLGIGFGAGLLAVAVYLATNPYPAYGAGLYTQIASEILAHGYRLPTHVPGYTESGVPLAYPPLQFYVLAVVFDLGGTPVTVARLLPSIAVLAALVPVYLLARDYTASRPAGAAATVAVALNPQLLQWHISAGGVVRAFAFCYAVAAIYAGYLLFERESRRAIAGGVVGFAAVLLSHPTYALFVVVSYLLLWVVRDRSAGGFVRGAIVGLGGVAVASPWLAWAVRTHGIDVFAAAAGTHGGVGGGVSTVLGGVSLTLLPLAGAAYLVVADRDAFLLAWAAAAELLFAQPRFVFTVGAIVLAAVGANVGRRIGPLGGQGAGSVDRRTAVAALLLVVGSVGGGVYLAHEMTLTSDPSTPEFLDDEALDAMAWAADETPPDATFVVVGDAAEWFPALTGRTLSISPWGLEWRDSGLYESHLDAYQSVSQCQSVDCVESAAATVHASPDYVYLPKGQYTVRGRSVAHFGTVERSFDRSPSWERAYENEGVVVYRSTD